MNDELHSFSGLGEIGTQVSRAGENFSGAGSGLSPVLRVPPNPIPCADKAVPTYQSVRGEPHQAARVAVPSGPRMSPELSREPMKAVTSTLPTAPDPLADHLYAETRQLSVGQTTPPRSIKSVIPDEPLTGVEIGAIDATVAEIRTLHRRAKFCEQQRISVGHRLLAYVRVEFVGFSTSDGPDARAKAVTAAQRILAGARKGRPSGLGRDADVAISTLAASVDASIEPFAEIEGMCLKRMEKLARTLPGYGFVKGVRGFGDRSFARIIGETGPLHRYANPGKVWKRMGLAVMDDGRQRKHANKELAAAHGYNPSRRSVSWVAFDSLLRAQGKDETAGPYRQLYDCAKERYLKREWPKIRAHRAAARYAEKRLLREVWRAWRDDIGGLLGVDTHPPGAPDPLPPGLAARVTQAVYAGRDTFGRGLHGDGILGKVAAAEPILTGVAAGSA